MPEHDSPEEELQAVYRERNLLAVAFTTLCYDTGAGAAGWYQHGGEGWAVVYVTLPEGQMSWHVPEELIPEDLPRVVSEEYDGHTPEQKNDRLTDYIRGDGTLRGDA